MSWKRIFGTGLLGLGLWTAPLLADWNTGVAAFRAGDLAAAEAHFRGVIDANPDWSGGHRMLGQTLLRFGRTAEAVPWLERASELAPGDVAAALILGQALVLGERFADAAEVLAQREPHALPSAQKVAFYTTRALGRLGGEEPQAALGDLGCALELEPGAVELHRLSAQAAQTLARRDLAIDHWKQVTELAEEDLTARRSLTRLLYERALEFEAEARPAACLDAAESARRLVRLDGGFEPQVLYVRAAGCAGLYEEARAAALAAAALDPDAWWPLYQVGRSEIGLRRWSEAVSALERVLAMDVPECDEPRLRRHLGIALEQQSRLEEALAQYRLAADEEAVARVERNRAAQDEAKRLRELIEEAARIEAELAALGASDQ